LLRIIVAKWQLDHRSPRERGRAGEIARASDHACRGRFGRASPRLLVALMLLGATLSFAAANVRADSDEDRRVRTGARLFRALLAADLALESKARPDGALHVLVYRRNPKGAQEVIELIAPAGRRRAGQDSRSGAPGGSDRRVALRDRCITPRRRLPRERALRARSIDRLVRWSIAQHVIVYSPFEGPRRARRHRRASRPSPGCSRS
jgi:hypothetical protein